MKKTNLLLISALFALTITGCGKKNNEQPEEPKENIINPESEEGVVTIKEALYKSVETYSNPTNFAGLGVDAEIRNVNVDLDLTARNEMYLENHLDFSLSDFGGDLSARAVLKEGAVEGQASFKNVQGKVAIEANFLNPLPEKAPEEAHPVVQTPSLGNFDGEEPEEGEEEPKLPEPVEAKGQFTIAPSNLYSYFKGGNIYIDYSDAGIRQTISNASDIYAQLQKAFNALMSVGEEPEEGEEIVEPDEEPALDLNAMIDFMSGAPDRKIYTVAEEEGFIVDSEDYVAPSEEKIAELKLKVDQIVDSYLPILVRAGVVSFSQYTDNSFKFSINLTKTKILMILPLVEALVEAQKAAEEEGEGEGSLEVQPQSLLNLEGVQQQSEPEEPTMTQQFEQMVEKCDINLTLNLDKDGLVRKTSLSYDIKAGEEDGLFKFFSFEAGYDISVALKGSYKFSFLYNDEVQVAMPDDLATYVCIDKQSSSSSEGE